MCTHKNHYALARMRRALWRATCGNILFEKFNYEHDSRRSQQENNENQPDIADDEH